MPFSNRTVALICALALVFTALPSVARAAAVPSVLNFQGILLNIEGGTSALACHCPAQGDMDASGQSDALDLAALIDALFAGASDPRDWTCPTTRADLDANGYPDAIDLALLIDYLFAGGPPPADPCAL